MQYIQGMTSAAAFAPQIALMNENNRLRRECDSLRAEVASLNAEIATLREIMYAEQGNEDESGFRTCFLVTCDHMADVMLENQELRAGLAAMDNENAELKAALLRALAGAKCGV